MLEKSVNDAQFVITDQLQQEPSSTMLTNHTFPGISIAPMCALMSPERFVDS